MSARQSKTDDGILACISNAYIKKVLILSRRSFVSPPPSEYESETSLGDMSKHSEKLARRERGNYYPELQRESSVVRLQ